MSISADAGAPASRSFATVLLQGAGATPSPAPSARSHAFGVAILVPGLLDLIAEDPEVLGLVGVGGGGEQGDDNECFHGGSFALLRHRMRENFPAGVIG